jgi:hypothetical protein
MGSLPILAGSNAAATFSPAPSKCDGRDTCNDAEIRMSHSGSLRRFTQ